MKKICVVLIVAVILFLGIRHYADKLPLPGSVYAVLAGGDSWKGYGDFTAFSRAADLEELFGYPVDDENVLNQITDVSDSLSLLSSLAELFLGKDTSVLSDIKTDLVSDWKLAERYNVPKALLNAEYKYLVKRTGKIDSVSYIAVCSKDRSDRWTVISWKEKTRKKI
jgi:hypothetical protein